MPTFTGEILYRVTDIGTYLSQEVINRYWYCDTAPSTPGTLENIALAFEGAIIDPLAAQQLPNAVHLSVKVEKFQIGSPVEYAEFGSTVGAGTYTGTAAPSIDAVGVVLRVGNNETRPGGKRYPSLRAEDISGNGLTGGGKAQWEAALSNLASDLVVAGGDNLTPVILRDVVYVLGVRTPLAMIDWVWNPITGFSVKPTVRPQSSRKP